MQVDPVMTVGQFIEKLQGYDHSLPVVLASDAEGNKFSPVDELALGHYVIETPWSWEVVDCHTLEEWLEDPAIDSGTKAYAKKLVQNPRVVVILPTN